MDASSTWPPPPDTPNPLAEHDGFLTACVLNLSDKRPVSRLSLAEELCEERGVDRRQSLAIVNDYCDRHLILPQARGPAAWGLSVMSLVIFAVVVIMEAFLWVLGCNRDASVTSIERLAITNEILNASTVLIIVTLVLGCINVAFGLRITKKRRRDAEDARKKLAA